MTTNFHTKLLRFSLGKGISFLLKCASFFEIHSKMTNEDIYRIQYKVLNRIVKKAQPTEFGQTYLSKISPLSKSTITQYKSLVPIMDYDMIKPWVSKCKNGEKNILWPGAPKFWARTSGTSTGTYKVLPIYGDYLDSINSFGFKIAKSIAKKGLGRKVWGKDILYLGSGSKPTFTNGEYLGFISGLSMNASPWYLNPFVKPNDQGKNLDWIEKVNLICRECENWDIGVICGIPTWIEYLFEKILESRNAGSISDIWPNLALICHGGHKLHSRDSLKRFLRHEVLLMDLYTSTEGYFGFQRPFSNSLSLVVNGAIFYEFVDYALYNESIMSGESFQTIGCWEVEESKPYVLIISNDTGLFRYVQGDIISFSSKEKLEFDLVGRISGFMNLCGEQVLESHVNLITDSLIENYPNKIISLSLGGQVTKDGCASHIWFLETKGEIEKGMDMKIDELLSNIHDYYKRRRVSGIIAEPSLKFVSGKDKRNWLILHGKIGNQFKFPVILTEPETASFLQFIQQN